MQFVEWFELDHISKSPARFDPQKLLWLNAHYIKQAEDTRLADLVQPFLRRDGCDPDKGPALDKVVALLKERINTVEELADAAVYFYRRIEPSTEIKAQHYTQEALAAISSSQSQAQRSEGVVQGRDSAGGQSGRGRAQAQDAQDRNAAARDRDRGNPDAFDRRHIGTDRARGDDCPHRSRTRAHSNLTALAPQELDRCGLADPSVDNGKGLTGVYVVKHVLSLGLAAIDSHIFARVELHRLRPST